MPRNMSFAYTTQQARDKSKDVTRRLGWWFLKPGDVVNQCVKCMGLRPGEKIERIWQIRILRTDPQSLCAIRYMTNDVIREGFPDLSADKFVEIFCFHMGCVPETIVNRIEFEYL